MSRAPLLRRFAAGAQPLAAVEWPGDAPPLLFVHGNGFHARCWDAVIEALPNRALALDLRGHGSSAAPVTPIRWPDFADDVLACINACDAHGAIGVGHSLGGHALVMAAARRPDAFAALLLLDPVMFPARAYGADSEPPAGVLRRRNRFASPEEMRERFAARPPFAQWDARVLADYCHYGLASAGEGGGFVLACAPGTEAAVYATGRAADANPWLYLAQIKTPVWVVRSGRVDPDNAFSRSPTAPELASSFVLGRDIVAAACSHYIPMEKPSDVAGLTRELAHSLNAI